MGSAFYDIEGFVAGADTLRPYEDADVGPVGGKRLVRLQCHIGLDTLSWPRRGATVTGADFSPPAIEAASSLAARLEIPASFVVSDVYDAADALGGQRFDIVCTGVGALVWLPDLTRWARVVVPAVRVAGGRGGRALLASGRAATGADDVRAAGGAAGVRARALGADAVRAGPVGLGAAEWAWPAGGCTLRGGGAVVRRGAAPRA
jgi:hypothetical protein